MVRWPVLAVLLLSVAALPSPSGAARAGHAAKAKHGVTAGVSHRALAITGNRRANSVTLRKRRGSLLVDVQSNGSADFRFRLKSVRRIAVDLGRGRDRLVVTGSGNADLFALSRKGRRLRITGGFTRATAAPRKPALSARRVETVQITPLGGADTVAIGNLSRTGVKAVAAQLGSRRGGDGAADTVSTGATARDDTLAAAGGPAKVLVRGLRWRISASNVEPGDRVSLNGLAGADTLRLSGSSAADALGLSAAGPLLHADLNGAQIESDGIEAIRLEPLAGQDTLTVGDLTGTDVGQVATDLGVTPAGLPDGQADTLTVSGGDGADTVAVSGGATGVIVSGLAAGQQMVASDPLDRLIVDGRGGADALSSVALAPNTTALVLRGGPGDDTITGGPADETIAWGIGDGSDVVEGGAGGDTAAVTGSDAPELFMATSSAGRAIVQGPSGTLLDTNDVEAANVVPGGGADTVAVSNLAGSELTAVAADFASGGADGQPDVMQVAGTTAGDTIKVAPAGTGAGVTGLSATATVVTAEPDTDNLSILGNLGVDLIDASALPAGVIGLTEDGGTDGDTLIGSPGRDLVIGGGGNDTALMGAGDDTFQWSPGNNDDVIEGQEGSDRLLVNGNGAAEIFTLTPNGGRLRFQRNVANVVLDIDKVETVDVNPLAGTDSVIVDDLTSTADVTRVRVDLAAPPGGPDTVADAVSGSGTSGADNIVLSGGPALVSVNGLFTALSVANGDAAIDSVVAHGAAGNDTINAAAVATGSPRVFLHGDANDDTLTGTDHVDTLDCGLDTDTAFATPGDNVFNCETVN